VVGGRECWWGGVHEKEKKRGGRASKREGENINGTIQNFVKPGGEERNDRD
jgi:hypothetical protein